MNRNRNVKRWSEGQRKERKSLIKKKKKKLQTTVFWWFSSGQLDFIVRRRRNASFPILELHDVPVDGNKRKEVTCSDYVNSLRHEKRQSSLLYSATKSWMVQCVCFLGVSSWFFFPFFFCCFSSHSPTRIHIDFLLRMTNGMRLH